MNDIGQCRRLRENEQTIVKFLQHKDCKQLFRCKKDLRSVIMNNIDLPEGTRLFLKENPCPYSKGL